MKRPLVVVAIGYIIGILWGLYFKCSIALIYVIIILFCFMCKIFLKSNGKFKLFSLNRYFRYIKLVINFNVIFLLIISSFISNIILVNLNKKYNNFYSEVSNDIQIIGVIVSNVEEKEYKDVYKIKVEEIDNEKVKDIYLLLSVKNNLNIKLDYGDKIQVDGEFQEPTEQRNYKGFDYKEYLKTQKIYGTIKADKIDVLDKNKANVITTFSNNIFLKIKEESEKVFSEDVCQLFLGIMLGYTDNLEDDIIESFRDSGIAHILAVSGMNVSYIVIGLTFILSFLGKRKRIYVIVIILIIYMCVTGFTPPIVRATIMGIVVLGAELFYKKSDIWTSIMFSMLIILIYNPFLINSISVILSYGGTIGIVLFNKTIKSLINKIKIKNRKYKYKYLNNKKLVKIVEFLKEIITVTISAQIIILPLTILYFNTIGISFLITNILISIIIGPIVIIGFLALIISFISIKLLYILSVFLSPLLNLLVIISNLGNALPLNKVYVPTPNIFELIVYYIIVIVFNFIYLIISKDVISSFKFRVKNIISLIKYNCKKNKNKIFCIFFIIIIVGIIIHIVPKDLKIFFIDVGQGDSTLIITPKNQTILIDGGGSLSSDYDVGESTLLPYLLDRKITKIDYMVISHFDQDHVGGLFTILNELKVKKVYVAKQAESSENFKKFINIVSEKNIKVEYLKSEDIVFLEKGVAIKVLHPSDNVITDNSINNNALVFKLIYNNFSMLFTGDIEEVAEKELIKNYKDTNYLNCDILKVAHHGSKSSSIEEFLNLALPKVALIGVGENNLYGHPANQVIERLENLNAKVYRTDTMGEINIIVNKLGIYKIKYMLNDKE